MFTRQPKNQVFTGRWNINGWGFLFFLGAIFSLGLATTHAQETALEDYKTLQDEALHSRLVNSALTNDFFNEKCRGMSVNKHFNEVNRLFINKYSLSANNYIESFFAKEIQDYKRLKQQEFIQKMSELQGCSGAKQQNWDRQIKAEYRFLLRKVEDSGWFPVVDRVAPADL